MGGILACAARHVGTAAPLPADERGGLLNQFASLEFRGEIGRDNGDEGDLAARGAREENDAAERAFQCVPDRLELVAGRAGNVLDDRWRAVDGGGLRGERMGSRGGLFLSENLELFLQAFLARDERVEFLPGIGNGRADGARERAQLGRLGERPIIRREPGNRFDAADAGGDGCFAHDAEKPDLPGGAGVSAGAELLRVAADVHDAHSVAVFVAEELHDVRSAFDVGVRRLRP